MSVVGHPDQIVNRVTVQDLALGVIAHASANR